MGDFDDSLGVFSDPDFTDPLYHHELLSDEGGEPEFTKQPRRTEAVVTAPQAADFELTPIGQNESLEFVLIAPPEAGFGDDDRIWHDNGLELNPYRLTSPRAYRPFAEDAYVKWSMMSDRRGEGADGTGENPEAPPEDDQADGDEDDDGVPDYR